MFGFIVAHELRQMLRDRRLVILTGLMLALFLVSIGVGAMRQAAYEADRDQAVAADRRIWLSQGEVNPHSAAHFGSYAFKPRAPMALFDPGLSPWLGDAVWLEAHYQNPAQARGAEADAVVQRFGDLSPAWMLQALLPLVIILGGFGMVSGERERGALRLQLVQGADGGRLIWGKFIALVLGAAVLVATLVGAGGLAALATAGAGTDLGVRWVGLLVVYLVYTAVWAAATVAVSSLARTARQSLLILLAVWTVGVVIAPRVAAEHAAAAHPVPSAGAFWDSVQEARAQGIDGHDPADQRAEAMKTALLRQYDVASVEDLPFDFAGVTLQAGEEHGNAVFDQLYGEIAAREQAQAATMQAYAPLSALLPVRALSAGLSGNDLAHQRAFTEAAETHRRAVQRRLNDEQRRTGKGQNFNNTVDAGFWRDVATFQYATPAVSTLAAAYGLPALILLAWLLAGLGGLTLAARRLEVSA